MQNLAPGLVTVVLADLAPEQRAQLLTFAQICARFKIARNTWWRLVKSGRAPQPIRLSARCLRWLPADIDAFEAAGFLESPAHLAGQALRAAARQARAPQTVEVG